MKITLPNILTAFRLVIFAYFIYLVDGGNFEWAVAAFVLAWGLDAVDGWLARWLNQESVFGYVFDKVADRIIVFCGLLVWLIYSVVPVYGFFILTKDVVVGLTLILMGRNGQVKSMGKRGKIMAILQGVIILWLVLNWPMGWLLVFVVAGLGLVMGVKYLIEV